MSWGDFAIVFMVWIWSFVYEGVWCFTTPYSTGCYTKMPNRPFTCLDKYAVIPGHINCLGNYHIPRLDTLEQLNIESLHNEVRSNVQPPAADMAKLKYNKGLERSAHVWSAQCNTGSNTFYQRFNPGSYAVGQNMLVSSRNLTWREVIHTWASQRTNFTYSSHGNNPDTVGSYAQIIWAKTSVVGCSMSDCGGTFIYVCNYAPSMDVEQIATPYIESASTSSCDLCPTICSNRICDCGGLICLNGARLNVSSGSTCVCDCLKGVQAYEGVFCELECHVGGDDPSCGTGKHVKSKCSSDQHTLFACPWMCDICPYAGANYTQRSQPLPYQRGLNECTTPTTTSTTTTPTTTTMKTTTPTTTTMKTTTPTTTTMKKTTPTTTTMKTTTPTTTTMKTTTPTTTTMKTTTPTRITSKQPSTSKGMTTKPTTPSPSTMTSTKSSTASKMTTKPTIKPIKTTVSARPSSKPKSTSAQSTSKPKGTLLGGQSGTVAQANWGGNQATRYRGHSLCVAIAIALTLF